MDCTSKLLDGIADDFSEIKDLEPIELLKRLVRDYPGVFTTEELAWIEMNLDDMLELIELGYAKERASPYVKKRLGELEEILGKVASVKKCIQELTKCAMEIKECMPAVINEFLWLKKKKQLKL